MIGSRPLTDQEIDLLKASAHLKTRDRALLILGATTGFRISELLSLRHQDVLHNGTALDRVTVFKRNRKGKQRSHTVLLHPEAKAALEALAYEQRSQPEHYLFKSQKGSNSPISPTQAWRRLTAAFEALNMQGKLGTHCMRKYFAGQVYEHTGHDIIATQRALGHRNLESTASYLSFKTEAIDTAILKLRHK